VPLDLKVSQTNDSEPPRKRRSKNLREIAAVSDAGSKSFGGVVTVSLPLSYKGWSFTFLLFRKPRLIFVGEIKAKIKEEEEDLKRGVG